jgi:hypothetical protein
MDEADHQCGHRAGSRRHVGSTHYDNNHHDYDNHDYDNHHDKHIAGVGSRPRPFGHYLSERLGYLRVARFAPLDSPMAHVLCDSVCQSQIKAYRKRCEQTQAIREPTCKNIWKNVWPASNRADRSPIKSFYVIGVDGTLILAEISRRRCNAK